MRLVSIPKERYGQYRLTAMFDCYKWDPQFLDSNTVAPYVLVLTEEEHEELVRLTEQLDEETRKAEIFLNENQHYTKPLALPGSVRREVRKMTNYNSCNHVRLMRYDFHPIKQDENSMQKVNWAISEVNSDVPGGFAEASLLQQAAMETLEENCWYKNFGEHLVETIVRKVEHQKKNIAGHRDHGLVHESVKGRIMLVHCTCYSDDRQVMQFLGDRLKKEGFQVIYGAADHISFRKGKAYSILDGNEGELDAIIRFTPLEWLTEIKPKRWQGYFDTTTVSCNHPVAIYAQTKRFPLIWDVLEENGIAMSTWRTLLPETIEVSAAKGKEGYIYKPACGRVGEKISIKEACVGDEYKKILADVKLHPKKYLAQKRFQSQPLIGENGEEFHVCIGSYAVDGKHAGYYARISELPRIDSNAADIPVLIEGENCKEEWLMQESMKDRKSKEMFSVWAPVGRKWVDWVRPVPFVGIRDHSKMYRHFEGMVPQLDCNSEIYKNAALIVDLPGAESVEEGIALARAGYRPVPIYNGTVEQQGARATVDNQSVAMALMWGALILQNIEIPDEALPAFLTDSNRMNRYKMEIAVFDNSWDVYPQDLPSADYFLQNGIHRIIVIGEEFSKDLRKILYSFQKKGIEIFYTKPYKAPKKVTLRRPFRKD